jgi:tRNA(Arg) A34 adenosine deaminase TadA
MDDHRPDDALMERAVRMALENIRNTAGGPFAALIAHGDQVVAEGVNAVVPTNDPTAHAEVVAIRSACATLHTVKLAGHVLYSTCLPCPMCLAAAHWAGIERVFYALSSEDAERMGFKDAHLYEMLTDPRCARLPESVLVTSPTALQIVRAWLANPDRAMY